MSRIEMLKKSDYEIDNCESQSSIYNSQIKEIDFKLPNNISLKQEIEPIKGEKAWSSTVLMRYLNKIKGKIQLSKNGEVTDPVVMLQDEFLRENCDELYANFSRGKRQEDKTKDIIAQENLGMDLPQL